MMSLPLSSVAVYVGAEICMTRVSPSFLQHVMSLCIRLIEGSVRWEVPVGPCRSCWSNIRPDRQSEVT